MTVFTTERLVVRQLRSDDLDDFAAICADPLDRRGTGDRAHDHDNE
jgi:hypothetical protein